MDEQQLKKIIEAVLLAAGEPLSIDRLLGLFPEDQRPERDEVRAALTALEQDCAERGIELKEVGSGFRFQVRSGVAEWVGKLWEERPPRYSRALLETLALIAYRQPITRAEIEEIRGVTVSTHIMKTLQEREWVRVVGHRDVPGKPAMYATTREFLDYFNLKSLEELPTLAEIRDIDRINGEFDLSVAAASGEYEAEEVGEEELSAEASSGPPSDEAATDDESRDDDISGASIGEEMDEVDESSPADEAPDVRAQEGDAATDEDLPAEPPLSAER